MTKRRKLAENGISQLLHDSKDEYKETNSGTLDTNDDDDEIDYISKKWDCESSNDNILDEFLQTQESVNEQYISEDKRKYSTLIQLVMQQEALRRAVFCDKNLDQPILTKECVTEVFHFWVCLCIKVK